MPSAANLAQLIEYRTVLRGRSRVQSPTGPTLRVIKQLRTKCYLCNNTHNTFQPSRTQTISCWPCLATLVLLGALATKATTAIATLRKSLEIENKNCAILTTLRFFHLTRILQCCEVLYNWFGRSAFEINVERWRCTVVSSSCDQNRNSYFNLL